MKETTTPSAQKESKKILTLAEQEALIKEEIQRFIKISKEKPSLTIEEINELLPAEIMAPQVLDAFMQGLENNGVVITDLAETSKGEDGEGNFLADPEKEDEEVDEEERKESEDVKGNDPVRLYLRKMGSVSLLTREGE